GPYEISFKDTATGNQITCDDDGGSVGTSSKITRSLSQGSYYLVVSSKSATSSGSYSVRFRDSTYWSSFGEIECDDDDGPGTTSLIERQLDAGDYWFFVKGQSSSNKGAYALRATDVNPPP